MKRNKLVLTSGILYVIASVILPLFSIAQLIMYVLGYGYMIDYGYAEPTHEVYMLVVITLLVTCLMCLAEAIVLLIFGIKAIKKSKTFHDGQNNSLVAGMVLGYIFSFFDFGGFEDFFGFTLILTGAILLSVAFGKLNSQAKKSENMNFVNSDEIKIDNNAKGENKDVSLDTIEKLKNQVQSLQSLRQQNLISEEEYLKMLKKLIDSSVDNR